MVRQNVLRVLFVTVCTLVINTSSLANDCESFAYTKNNVHICDCPYIPNTKADKNDLEELLRAIEAKNCSGFPVSVEFDDPIVPIPAKVLDEDGGDGIVDVDLRFLSSATLQNMSEENLNILLNLCGQKKAKIQWHHIGRFHHSHRLAVNAAAALALKVGIEKQFTLLARMLALTPEAIVPIFDGRLSVLVDFHFVTDALMNMTKKINDQNMGSMARTTSKLVHYYLRFWSAEKIKTLRPLLARLVMKMTNIMNENLDYKMDLRQKGILLGSLFAGSLLYAKEIKSIDDKRVFILNTTTNLTWAATAFLGAMPVAGNIIAAVGGIVSMTVVSTAAIYQRHHPRDAVPSVKEVQGDVEMNIMSAYAKDDDSKMLEVVKLKYWMGATIHANGFAD